MKSKLLIRIAAGCTLFFALGHTMGHLSRKESNESKVKEVIRLMEDTKFDLFGQLRSFDENYTGMSLNLIFTLLAFTLLLWFVSALSETDPKSCRNLLVPILLCLLGFAVTSYVYFFPVPAITCVLASIALVTAVLRLPKVQG